MTQTEALKLTLEALDKLTSAAEGFSVSGVYFNEELWARKCLDDAYDAMGFAQEALAQPEPFTEWLTCPKCNHQSPYSPIKAKTLEEEAVRITAQAMQALSQMQRVPKYKASQIHPATDVIMVADLKRFGIKV